MPVVLPLMPLASAGGRCRRTARFRGSRGASGRLRKCELRHKGEARSQSDYRMFHIASSSFSNWRKVYDGNKFR